MKLVLTGENLTALYARQKALLETWRGQGKQVRSFDAFKDTPESILEALGTQTMFGPAQAWQVTGLEKLKSPKLQLQLLDALLLNPDEVVLTIPVDLSGKAFAKKVGPPAWKVELFKLPKVVFNFLESIKVRPYAQVHELYRQSLAAGEEWGIHALLCRQLRSMLAIKVGLPVAGAPFFVNKIRSQAQAFSTDELAEALHELYLLERSIKTGQTALPWSSQVDIILARLYDSGH